MCTSFGCYLVEQAAEYAAPAAAAIGVGALGLYLATRKGAPAGDDATVQRLAKEILSLKPTIGDAGAYPFAATHGRYVNELNSKNGTLSMMAAGLKAYAKGKSYKDSPEEIVQMGRDLLSKRSGQCDHMAAAVIAKIVDHIQNGGAWNSKVELMGNGAHAFVVINRGEGDPNSQKTWETATVVDTWLGVHENYRERLPSPQDGVLSNPEGVRKFALCFGARDGRIQVQHTFTPEELKALACR